MFPGTIMSIDKTIHVSLRNGYDVHIGTDLLKRCGHLFIDLFPSCKILVVTDSNVSKLYLDTVLCSLQEAGIVCWSYVFPAGESNKNIDTYQGILSFLASNHFNRSDIVVALGGGVCGDMAGFAAGTYMRGIKYIQIPTTVLSMVDSSVGGKCAVDLPEGKNLVGVFHQPSLVLCDISTLKTLPDSVFADGMAEAIKTGILRGEDLFNLCENYDKSNLATIISKCIEYKAGVVERDETEQGERKLLNLGHTAGHAIELCSGYTVPHGHAVAIGTAIITRASESAGSSNRLSSRVEQTLSRFGLPLHTDISPEELLSAAMMDKKSQGQTINVIIPEDIGKCRITSISFTALLELFKKGQ